uniref:Uncharacterized protein n=1 Tax=Glossina pallidipes TaxID=7398 RepID=A0A1A9ZCW9_GLOPL
MELISEIFPKWSSLAHTVERFTAHPNVHTQPSPQPSSFIPSTKPEIYNTPDKCDVILTAKGCGSVPSACYSPKYASSTLQCVSVHLINVICFPHPHLWRSTIRLSSCPS